MTLVSAGRSGGCRAGHAAAGAVRGAGDRSPAPSHPSEVSYGEQQRAAIARCLLGAPALCVLDEPTGHQDEASAALVADQLLAARAAGSSVLVATHDEVVIDAADVLIWLL